MIIKLICCFRSTDDVPIRVSELVSHTEYVEDVEGTDKSHIGDINRENINYDCLEVSTDVKSYSKKRIQVKEDVIGDNIKDGEENNSLIEERQTFDDNINNDNHSKNVMDVIMKDREEENSNIEEGRDVGNNINYFNASK